MNRISHFSLAVILTLQVMLCAYAADEKTTYVSPDPVGHGQTNVTDLVVQDLPRQRKIPLRVYLPPQRSLAPVIVFSHGLGGSRQGNAFLGRHWSARGYVVVFIQHPGSDTSVWQDKPAGERLAAMKRAASIENFHLRVKDVPAVLDQLTRWNSDKGHALAGRLDLQRVGMSGHSFGALTTQAVSGQIFPAVGALFSDSRISAALILSPSGPRRGSAEQAFGTVELPWMLMTGTRDTAPIGDTDLASRLSVFPALPAGGKYELVLSDAEHSAFTDQPLPGDTAPRNPNHHRAMLSLSTAFWDAWLNDDASAKSWLSGNGPRSTLDAADRWQAK